MEQNEFVMDSWALTYIISNSKIKEAYVGESISALKRMRSHIKNPEREKLKTLHLITSKKFNKSSALDIESNLIKYLSADGQFELQNGNAGLSDHSYYQRESYTNLFKAVWAGLQEKGLAKKGLLQIDNSDLFKYSPYKSLSPDQHEAVSLMLEILTQNKKNTVFVEGSAGTGKTILAVYIIKLLRSNEIFDVEFEDEEAKDQLIQLKKLKRKIPNPKVALVVPMTSLRQTIKKVFRNVKGLNAKMVIGPSEVVKDKYDLLIVDEAHRLHRRVGITNYASFDSTCQKLGMDKHKANELDWIMKQSTQQIFFYDQFQSIRPSDIPREVFINLGQQMNISQVKLTSQMRVKGGVDYLDFVDNLLGLNFPKGANKFRSKDYDLRLFDSLKDLISELIEKEKTNGLCRLVAGYAWPWNSKKDKNAVDIEIDGLKLQWNKTNNDWINSDNAFKEVGCIHTTQGYDLNYVGIIFGTEISYDPESKKIIVREENYFDRNGKVSIEDQEVLKNYIINIYKTLMLRGIKGTYLYVCNDQLRDYFERWIGK
ncbi:DUF2075 domain-containing protein [Crocinitomix catalasitica]|nr:DUF2075 domain-containing protein [Crocinitomix catalasitica]